MLPSTVLLIATLSNVIAHAYQTARQRLASSGSPIMRMIIGSDHAITDVALLEREGDAVYVRASLRQLTFGGDPRLLVIDIRFGVYGSQI